MHWTLANWDKLVKRCDGENDPPAVLIRLVHFGMNLKTGRH